MKHDTRCTCEGCTWAKDYLKGKIEMNRPSCHGDFPSDPRARKSRVCYGCAYLTDCCQRTEMLQGNATKMHTDQMTEWYTPGEALGTKTDKGKPRWSLLPAGTIAQVIKVLEFGVARYAVDNWMHVEDPKRRYYDAAMRHLQAWWGGEKMDPDSGLPHLAHAACCILFLMWFDERRNKTPDVSELVEVMKRRGI